ncbi:VOC family protein [Mucilaginibacter sp.]|uniref:VOC family protein n=1 Tax=Mucilaginibacter sp. TaxID=1882438 RepID=UPI00263113D6|nr:VOC family protein [Mucilaginibacter sp.]MDB4926525.1 glyoxalase [Mucilaginibacter sp.]
MAKINPYLNFLGKTEEAFNFYKSVFGGEFLTLQRFKDTPHGDSMSAEDKEKIMHVALPIGGNILMGTDALESMGQNLKFGDNFSIAIDPESMDEANSLFNGLAVGGQVMMPLEKMFWGAWFGMLVDKYGVQWMVNYDDSQK